MVKSNLKLSKNSIRSGELVKNMVNPPYGFNVSLYANAWLLTTQTLAVRGGIMPGNLPILLLISVSIGSALESRYAKLFYTFISFLLTIIDDIMSVSWH